MMMMMQEECVIERKKSGKRGREKNGVFHSVYNGYKITSMLYVLGVSNKIYLLNVLRVSCTKKDR